MRSQARQCERKPTVPTLFPLSSFRARLALPKHRGQKGSEAYQCRPSRHGEKSRGTLSGPPGHHSCNQLPPPRRRLGPCLGSEFVLDPLRGEMEP